MERGGVLGSGSVGGAGGGGRQEWLGYVLGANSIRHPREVKAWPDSAPQSSELRRQDQGPDPLETGKPISGTSNNAGSTEAHQIPSSSKPDPATWATPSHFASGVRDSRATLCRDLRSWPAADTQSGGKWV